jgi:putative ABC transport system permease protein
MRTLLASLRVALGALWRSKVRSLLTALGILIGIAAVVVVTALGQGARERVGGELESLGSNLLFVWPMPAVKSGVRTRPSAGLTDDDALAIRREATAVSAVGVYSEVAAQTTSELGNGKIAVIGVDLPYFGVRGFRVRNGRLWNESEELTKSKVCLIGRTASQKLFPGVDPIGHYVRVGRHPFRVIGTLEPKGQSPFEDQDDRILMPIGSWRARVSGTLGRRVQLLVVSALTEARVEQARRQLDAILRQRHGFAEGEETDYRVRTLDAFRRTQDAVYGALTALLLSVAAVSLFAGGVGVMNIMLVSVTERTREIGVRMAIGARRGDIAAQFLAEAVALTLVGGLLGLGAAVAAIVAIQKALGWSMSLEPQAVATALGTSLAVGLVFGLLPARRAASLDPIEALRHE